MPFSKFGSRIELSDILRDVRVGMDLSEHG